MNALLDVGANLVDTAQCYAGSEAMIGRHLAHRRDEMVIVTKCGHHEVLANGRMRSRAISMDDIDGALQRLNTDYLDAMLLHSYDFDLLVQGDALAILEAARDAGKIRHIGYSGDNERLAWAVSCPLITVVEVSVNLVDQHNLREALRTAAARNSRSLRNVPSPMPPGAMPATASAPTSIMKSTPAAFSTWGSTGSLSVFKYGRTCPTIHHFP